MKVKRNTSSFFGQTVGSVFVTAISKIFAFARTVICAALYGATGETDAFFTAVSLISILSGPPSSLTTVIVPARTQALYIGRQQADVLTSGLLNMGVLVGLVEGVMLYFFAPVFVHLFAPNFKDEIYLLTVKMVRAFIPVIALLVLSSVICGILNTHQKFVAANLIGLALNIGWAAIPLIFARKFGIFAMVFGYILGTALQVIILLPALSKVYKYFFFFDFKGKEIRQSLLLCLPVFVGTFAQQINQAIDKVLASGLREGNISALGYATQLITLVQGVIAIPLSTAFYTLYANCLQENDIQRFKELIRRSISLLILIMLPITVYGTVFSTDIVFVIFQRGVFDSAANKLTSYAFVFYLFGILPAALTLMLTRCYYALRDTRTPLYINFIGIAVNILVSIICIKSMGIGGLALGTSIASFVTAVAMILYLQKKIGSLGLINLWNDILKIVGALIVFTGMAYVFIAFYDTNPFLRILVSFGSCMLFYIGSLTLMRQYDIVYLLKLARSK